MRFLKVVLGDNFLEKINLEHISTISLKFSHNENNLLAGASIKIETIKDTKIQFSIEELFYFKPIRENCDIVEKIKNTFFDYFDELTSFESGDKNITIHQGEIAKKYTDIVEFILKKYDKKLEDFLIAK